MMGDTPPGLEGPRISWKIPEQGSGYSLLLLQVLTPQPWSRRGTLVSGGSPASPPPSVGQLLLPG